eukprot:128633_1
MGCSTSTLDDEILLNIGHSNETEQSITSGNEYERSYKSLMERPKCKCSENLQPYELQCCYLNEQGETSVTEINCDLCAKSIHDPSELVWHCLKYASHGDFSYDLCYDCGLQQQESTTKSTSSIIADNDEKKDELFEIVFDPKYNMKDIDWNKLYNMCTDEATHLKINSIIKDNIELNNMEQYNLPSDILEFVKSNQKAVENTLHVHDACNDETGWTLQGDSDGIKISYKKEENAVFHSIKAEFNVEASILDFVASLNEFDLLGALVKFVKVETKMLHEFTNNHKVVYMRTALYWPLKDMDFIMQVNGCNALEELNEVIIFASSPKDDKIEGVDIPSVTETGTMRVEIVRLDVCCKPIRFGEKNKKDITKLIMIYNVDFKISLPQKVINWILRTLSSIFVKVLRARCENLKGSETAKRMDSKDIYRKWRLYCMRAKKQRAEQTSMLTVSEN